MAHKAKAILDTDRRQLGTLLNLAQDADHLWRDDELGAILRHQLTVPLQVDLINLERGLALKIRNLAEAQGLVLKSFGDLLAHPNPPVELLKVIKDFAKACRLSPHSPMPHDIASVLYFACIASAVVRCRTRISGLSNAELSDGFKWILKKKWVDAPTRALVEDAVKVLTPQKRGARV
jgi:hypothetical protein